MNSNIQGSDGVPTKCLLDTEVIQCLISTGKTYAASREFFIWVKQQFDCYVSPITIGEVQRLRWFRRSGPALAQETLNYMNELPCFNLTQPVAARYAGMRWTAGTKKANQNNCWQVCLAQENRASLATLDDGIIKQGGVAILSP